MIKLKHRKYKTPKKSRQKMRTQPIKSQQQQEEDVALNAKNFLIDLTKDEGQHHQFQTKFKSKLDISLSEWSNAQKTDYRLSERTSRFNSLNLNNRLEEIRTSNRDFNSIEMSLIDQHKSSNSYEMHKLHFAQFKRTKEVTQSINTPLAIKTNKNLSNIHTFYGSLPQKRLKIPTRRQQNTERITRASKIDINFVQKSNEDDRISKQRQKNALYRSRLPRLQHLQGQKNKYKSIFRVSNRKTIILLPLKSPISKDLNKIYDLIKEESTKVIKKFI